MNLIRSNYQPQLRLIQSGLRLYSRKIDAEKIIPRNVLDDKRPQLPQPNGPIVDKKPFKMTLKAGKRYAWCLCGQSKTHPLCDKTHGYVHNKITLRPVFFEVEKDGDYYICMCRQTKHRPFCDGAHKDSTIQEKNCRFL